MDFSNSNKRALVIIIVFIAGIVMGLLYNQSDFPKELRYAENPEYICIQNELFRLYGQLYVIDILDSYDLKLREWCKQEGYVEE